MMVRTIEEAPRISLKKDDAPIKLTEEINIGGGVIKLGAKLTPELKRDITQAHANHNTGFVCEGLGV